MRLHFLTFPHFLLEVLLDFVWPQSPVATRLQTFFSAIAFVICPIWSRSAVLKFSILQRVCGCYSKAVDLLQSKKSLQDTSASAVPDSNSQSATARSGILLTAVATNPKSIFCRVLSMALAIAPTTSQVKCFERMAGWMSTVSSGHCEHRYLWLLLKCNLICGGSATFAFCASTCHLRYDSLRRIIAQCL